MCVFTNKSGIVVMHFNMFKKEGKKMKTLNEVKLILDSWLVDMQMKPNRSMISAGLGLFG